MSPASPAPGPPGSPGSPGSPARPAHLACTVNGRAVSLRVAPDRSLLSVLREDLDVISPKNGCEPQASCGCCAVLVDGAVKLACAMKASAAAGREIVTLEGLDESDRAQIADCFARSGGLQCGFCIPGIALRAHALLGTNPDPTRDQIARALRAHLCRCTGYVKIVDAIDMLARERRQATAACSPAPPTDTPGAPRPAWPAGVGARLERYRGREFALGDFRYVDDIKIPGCLYAAMRFSDHPRALVAAIDPAPALSRPGVQRVITAADVPGQRHVGLIVSDWPVLVAAGEETRCVGDVLAIAVADTQDLARKAAAAIRVDYEVREPIATPEDALRPDAPKIHPQGNLLSRSAFARGDADAAFAGSAHVVENTYTTQRIEHMFLEPEACIAIPQGTGNREQGTEGAGQSSALCAAPDGSSRANQRFARADAGPERLHAEPRPLNPEPRTLNPEPRTLNPEPRTLNPEPRPLNPEPCLRVLSQGQGVFDDQRQIASVLGWDPTRVHVELVSNGGAFGGKEDMSIQAQTALAAVLTGRPVKCTLTREESFRLHPKRHPVKMHLRVGCDADGRLTAVRARMIGDKGAYASVGAKVLERAAGHAIGPYKCDHVDIESLAVYTNNPPCGAMRGFGANQAAFAIERCLDALAKKVGIDGWEIRWRNVLDPGDRFCTGQRLDKPFGLRQTLLAVRDAYRAAKYAGIACGIKNVGIGNGLPEAGRAVLTVESPDRITIRSGFTEMGQGYFTILIQTAVQETGLPPHLFHPITDTSVDVNCGQTTASRATVLGALAVIDACRKLVEEARRHEGTEARRGGEQGTGNGEQDGRATGGEKRRSDEATERQRDEATERQWEGGAPAKSALSRSPIPDPGSLAHNAGAKIPSRTLAALVGRSYLGHHETPATHKPGDPTDNPRTHLSYGFATQVVILDERGALAKVIAAHDVGRVMNPTLLEGQIEGSIHMGLGYALTEDFPCEGGRPTHETIKSLGVLRAHQMPPVECIFIEEPDPETPYGARGVGEIGLVPTAPAVAAALEAFDGVHRTSLPMKDARAAKAISNSRGK